MGRHFHYNYSVRYDECDYNGFLTTEAFLRYLQDIAGRDAEEVFPDSEGFWVIKRTLVSFSEPVQMHTDLEIDTYALSFTRVSAQRAYEARLKGSAPESEPVITARSLWVYLDQRGRPARVPERTVQLWLPDGPVRQVVDEPWPAFPAREPEQSSFVVPFSAIDNMKHMNNTVYVETLDNAAWESYLQAGITLTTADLRVHDYEIEYSESALLGDHLEVQTWFEPFPVPGQEFTRWQQITRNGSRLVRARSRWHWTA
ncbi:acyl-[acyl-carrier-protein] thioesterase [Tengunoibacter tsumagoiensis]|uniref:Acyl-ACP thioesterase N-terminal hotdog domain-containing protein n=1 Tax=Tengunoibacter tsumagoiensis TaxID=2014871 RepID=A0A401ZU87_9CHLR|nr:acyl-ACP thioesterase domain-containing protein [Tengunoibacter tsumagoiensis]GCE10330.1 hypothetical protein KTT_01890 [Tengunoibacter tsumagoiensis]